MSDGMTLERLEEIAAEKSCKVVTGRLTASRYTVAVWSDHGIDHLNLLVTGIGKSYNDAADDAAKQLVQRLPELRMMAAYVEGLLELAGYKGE